LGYRDKVLVSQALERLVISADFVRLAPVLSDLFASLPDAQEKKRIAEQALGHMRTHRRVPPDALAELLVKAELGPNPGAAEYKNMGELYSAWGNFAKAAAYYEAALKKSPGDADLYRDMGRLNHQMGKPA